MFSFGKLASKIFGSSNERAIKSILPIVKKINDHEEEIKNLSDEQIAKKTSEFKERIRASSSLILMIIGGVGILAASTIGIFNFV